VLWPVVPSVAEAVERRLEARFLRLARAPLSDPTLGIQLKVPERDDGS
jgi:hypothetical protein